MRKQKMTLILVGLIAMFCLGIQFLPSNPVRHLPVLDAGKIRQQSSATVAFVYAKDLTGATAFQSLLNSNGLTTDLIKSSSISSTSLVGYSLIVIGPDTGTWTNATSVSFINSTRARILGIGVAGSRFLGRLGLPIGFPNDMGYSNVRYAKLTAYFVANFNTPYAIPAGNTTMVTSPVFVDQCYNSTYIHVLGDSFSPGYHDIVQQPDGYILWGFNCSASLFTSTGAQVFVDIASAQSSWKIAFVYTKDQSGALSFQALLNSNMYPTDLIKISTITSTTLVGYSSIIIGPDTGTWTNSTLVTMINGSSAKILAIGEGGYRFLGSAGLAIGYPHGSHDPSIRYTNFTSYFASNFNFPYVLHAGNTTLFTTGVDLATISNANIPGSDHVLSHYNTGGSGDIIQHGNRYIFWGFNGSASQFTSNGSKAFIDVAAYSASQPSSDQSGDDWPMIQASLNHTCVVSTAPVIGTNISWVHNTFGNILSSPAVVNGRMYFGAGDWVYCLNAFSGNQIWNYSTTVSYHVTSSPAVANGRVYVGGGDAKVYCLDAFTGSSIWNYTTNGVIGSSPAVANGRVYIGSYDGKVYCLNAITGSQIWNYSTGDSIRDSSPAIAGGRVYVGSTDNKTYCLNATTGAHIWDYTTKGWVTSSPTVAGGSVYVGSWDHSTYCLNAITGALTWRYNATNKFTASPAVMGGRVYIGCCDYKMYCLDTSTGNQIWNYTTGYCVLDAPAIAGGYVYFASEDAIEYCLNAMTGALVWYYNTGTWMECNTAIAGGQVYVGNALGKMFCFPMVILPSMTLNLQATAMDRHVELSWTAPSTSVKSITGYRIYKGTTSGGETLVTTTGNVLNYDVAGLTNGQIYFFKVAAVNSQGTGPNSTEASATPLPAPGAPTGLTATGGNKTVTLTWVAPASAGGSTITGYIVYRSTSSGSETLIAYLGVVLTYTNTGLTNGQIYYYQVTAVNAMGESVRSNEASATPLKPGAPTGLTATGGNANVTLTWVAPASNGGSAITGYKVYRGNSSGTEAFLMAVGNITTWIDTNVKGGQVYYYKVSAVNAANEGPLSAEATATPKSTGPSVPGYPIECTIGLLAIACVVSAVKTMRKHKQ